jgi:hypothetical protein
MSRAGSACWQAQALLGSTAMKTLSNKIFADFFTALALSIGPRSAEKSLVPSVESSMADGGVGGQRSDMSGIPDAIGIALSPVSARLLLELREAFGEAEITSSMRIRRAHPLPLALEFDPESLDALITTSYAFKGFPDGNIKKLTVQELARDCWLSGMNDRVVVYANRVEVQLDCGAAGILCARLCDDMLREAAAESLEEDDDGPSP